MSLKVSSTLLSIAILLIFSSTASFALNITKILSPYSEYDDFSSMVNKTGINDMVKNRQVITVLVLDKDAMSTISNRSQDELKRILMTHIVLDYYDVIKIQKQTKKSALLTNLYQTTGTAQDEQGYLNLTKLSKGNTVFGSAVKGSPLVAKLVESVLAQPFNISVLHVSTPIVAKGIGEAVLPPPPPPGSAIPSPAPKKGGAESPDDGADDDDYDSPSPSPTPAKAPAPSKSKKKKASPPAPDADADGPSGGAWRAASGIGLVAIMGLVLSFVANF